MKKKVVSKIKKIFHNADLSNENVNLDFVEYMGLRLPPPSIRFCTTDWKNDEFFIKSASREVKRLEELAGLNVNSTILDIGSGQGRLPIGILATLGKIKAYFGVDVSMPSVEWCKRNISEHHPCFHFIFTDFQNPRYSPKGVEFRYPIQLPLADKSCDVIFLYSVFTHMDSDDVIAYLREIRRLLTPQGRALFTIYVEDDCPDEEENPASYLSELGESTGRLHRVRFNQKYFENLISLNHLKVSSFKYRCEDVTKQSVYVVGQAS
jgi:SAM-dependent methyltransferase